MNPLYKDGQIRRNLVEDCISQTWKLLRNIDGLDMSFDYIGIVDAEIGPFIARAGQGITRQVEPVNEFYKLFTDQSGAPDLNMVPYEYQGYIKYIDGLVGGVTPFGSEEAYSDLPKKLDTFGRPKPTSVGKQIMFRQSGEPISAEMMMNAAGMSSWKATDFDGPATVKRKMPSLVNPYFEVAAIKYLNKYPDFFEMEQKKKAQIVADMQKEVQGNVKALFEDGHMPQSLTMLRDLSKPSNKKKALEAMKFLGITGSLEDVYKREDALSKLNLINVLTPVNLLVSIYSKTTFFDLIVSVIILTNTIF